MPKRAAAPSPVPPQTSKVFNPLDKENLGATISRAILDQAPVQMPIGAAFPGAGVYVIYYLGDFPNYGPIAEANRGNRWDLPIYVGKAVPKGSRKGDKQLNSAEGTPLFTRLGKHAQSLDMGGLNPAHFWVRHLVIDDVWIPLGESLLIQRFRPVWNVVLDGFGNNPPGKGRNDGKLSAWDTVHPRRTTGKPNPITRDEWLVRVDRFLANGELQPDPDQDGDTEDEAEGD